MLEIDINICQAYYFRVLGIPKKSLKNLFNLLSLLLDILLSIIRGKLINRALIPYHLCWMDGTRIYRGPERRGK